MIKTRISGMIIDTSLFVITTLTFHFVQMYVTFYNMLSPRPQNIEDVLEKDLFPVSLSVEERIRHWLFLFSNSVPDHKNGFFSSAHEKALTAVVSQKKR